MKRFLTLTDLGQLPADKYGEFEAWLRSNEYASLDLPFASAIVDVTALLHWLRDNGKWWGDIGLESDRDGTWWFVHEQGRMVHTDNAPCPVDALWAACKRVMGVET